MPRRLVPVSQKVYGKNSKVMQNTFGNPDFAFPETVGANAEAALKNGS